MDCYEELVDYAEQHGLEVIEKEFKSSAKGLCKGKKIGISKTIDSTVEKRCVLVEEMAHCYHTVGDILDTRNPLALKQELYARAAAFGFLLPISKLVDAYLRCEHNLYELPEYLNVTFMLFINYILLELKCWKIAVYKGFPIMQCVLCVYYCI